MNKIELQLFMNERAVKVSDIARKLGLSTVYIYDILKGSRNNRKVASEFESTLGLRFEAIREAWNNNNTTLSAPEMIAMQKRIAEQYGLKTAVGQ